LSTSCADFASGRARERDNPPPTPLSVSGHPVFRSRCLSVLRSREWLVFRSRISFRQP
jgi:hypothetical protein